MLVLRACGVFLLNLFISSWLEPVKITYILKKLVGTRDYIYFEIIRFSVSNTSLDCTTDPYGKKILYFVTFES